jgi:hypothetical protein
VDWCFLASRGASGGILLMWDGRDVKIKECVVEFIAAPLETLKMVFGLLQGFIGLSPIVIKRY